ncbi:MAG TPA: hypothetical protein VKG02_19130, partial [Blastocatellia bacterium]|nr:hypothetical protein [Blastocatellia bacterium]
MPIANSTLPIVSQGSSCPILSPAIQLAMRNARWPMKSGVMGLTYTIGFSKAGLGSVAARAAEEVLSYLYLKDYNPGLNSSCSQSAVWE